MNQNGDAGSTSHGNPVFKVPFTTENINRCFCTMCTVQSNNQSVEDKLSRLDDIDISLPRPEDVPGLYCSSGAAKCQDIDTTEACICFGCPVYKKYILAESQPTCYYCVRGEAR